MLDTTQFFPFSIESCIENKVRDRVDMVFLAKFWSYLTFFVGLSSLTAREIYLKSE